MYDALLQFILYHFLILDQLQLIMMIFKFFLILNLFIVFLKVFLFVRYILHNKLHNNIQHISIRACLSQQMLYQSVFCDLINPSSVGKGSGTKH